MPIRSCREYWKLSAAGGILQPSMKLPYSENDAVYKEIDPAKLVEHYISTGFAPASPALKERIYAALERARQSGSPIELSEPYITLGWDDAFEAHYLVIHDTYDPENLIAMLYDRLVRFEEDELANDVATASDLIQRYVGRIEAKEGINLSEIKLRLIELASKMKETVHLFLEDEFNEDDIENLSKALDRAYYEPLTETLEGVLVSIAGNKSSLSPGR
jgi:hypothetical protein